MSDVADLKAEVSALRAENAELRKHVRMPGEPLEIDEKDFYVRAFIKWATEEQPEVKRLEAENEQLRELCKRFAEYVSQDRCEGCICKSRCNEGEIEECWQLAEIREAAHELGVEV